MKLHVGPGAPEIEGDTAPEEHPPRMHWELLSSVQGQNAKAHLGANLFRIWDDGCFYASEAVLRGKCTGNSVRHYLVQNFTGLQWNGRKFFHFLSRSLDYGSMSYELGYMVHL